MVVARYEDDTMLLREAFAGFPCGVAALAAVVDREPTVLIASSFTVGVSQDPPLVAFAVQRSSSTWPELTRAETIGVSVLGETHAPVTRQLAARDKAARFAGIEYAESDSGAIFLPGAPVWLECTVAHTYPAGDHDLIVLQVQGLGHDFGHQPLVWHRAGFATLVA
ncbi:MAG TPA: flavin reductase family protein [Microbacteriaceae bacterium]|nr:flavin reductase family protein [Microbacteriaceae bacterium]